MYFTVYLPQFSRAQWFFLELVDKTCKFARNLTSRRFAKGTRDKSKSKIHPIEENDIILNQSLLSYRV